ncbi:ComEC/Rec2 family competence protein [Desulfitobacterium metallireducens]|uniref:Beta-lactamase n=1 Tax=Desulfitobacterium metallireducens DSM 15288 TaxID=871968 RepID=W0EBZ9_9FIRM|nr:ComEC/Rec2 family competence protein [Desulfitobacterium metallireducens]AHF07063.1 beta-lactamase [Desulfitobacterium metallireducens DSM 15288]
MATRCTKLTEKLSRVFIVVLLVSSCIAFITGCGVTTGVSTPSQGNALISSQPMQNGEEKLRVSYIDVGQGDSILIQIPNGKNVLIDAGENDQGDKVVSYIRSQGVKRLDLTIWTHPHSDHIGGADAVTKAFDIGQIVMPKQTSSTQSFRSLLTAISQKGLKITEAKAGLKLDLGSEVKAEMLAPNSTQYEEVNDYSAVLRLTYGQTAFLFTGDAQSESEQEMMNAGYDLRADVLKVGHHGSRTSTSAAFLARVQPEYAVISVGNDNDYGHPTVNTLTRLQKAGVSLYRTDESGTVVAESDGKNITFTVGRTSQ